ncbi:hypothetical protein B6N60_00551 [Richelia sinica FACHB-800]|uniref:Uncharacterized protein n=1 Tax=Richelia sinica FACHB-800 TaxID=1357546 RepID=A0A975T484_9NOST|nr:hypothetical protein B6N60_00551 [Richelia sinica FACHB-800]
MINMGNSQWVKGKKILNYPLPFTNHKFKNINFTDLG